MKNQTLLIVGAGGHGKAVAEAAFLSGQWQRIVFLDDRWPELQQCAGWPVVAKVSGLVGLASTVQGAITAIGNNAMREQCLGAICNSGVPLVSAIHPSAFVSSSARIGAGTAVMAMAMIGVDAVIGLAAIVNANTTVDHDATLDDYAHLGVGVHLAGGVHIKARAWLQAGCSAGYDVVVNEDAILGPGTVLVAGKYAD
jgi:sugar O-acyltransferase (sialic acid O-acetyltransferase NeuD family)